MMAQIGLRTLIDREHEQQEEGCPNKCMKKCRRTRPFWRTTFKEDMLKTEEQIKHHIAHRLRKRCIKKKRY